MKIFMSKFVPNEGPHVWPNSPSYAGQVHASVFIPKYANVDHLLLESMVKTEHYQKQHFSNVD